MEQVGRTATFIIYLRKMILKSIFSSHQGKDKREAGSKISVSELLTKSILAGDRCS
jgi:hypothetical protein